MALTKGAKLRLCPHCLRWHYALEFWHGRSWKYTYWTGIGKCAGSWKALKVRKPSKENK